MRFVPTLLVSIPNRRSNPIAVKNVATKKAAKKSAAKKTATKRAPRKVAKAAEPVEIVEEVAESESEEDSPPAWVEVVKAIQEKKGRKIRILDLRDVTTFTDYFIVTNGTNTRQNMAICNEVENHLKKTIGDRPMNIEGYGQGEWVLMDYGDYIVHVFTEEKRAYYDLERLYRNAKVTEIPDED